MPLLAVRLPESTFVAMQELVEAGRYRDIQQFVEVAAVNQLALERSAAPAELMQDALPGRTDTNVVREAETLPYVTSRGHRKTRKLSLGRISKEALLDDQGATENKAEWLAPFEAGLIHPERLDARELSEPAAPTEYVFGQVNRYFPFKVACRGLAVLASRQGTWPRYSVVSESLADDAAKLGSLLEHQDLESGSSRDNHLATGLPKRGNSASRDRFLSQLFARVTRIGNIYPGALCQYQLAAFDADRLKLTQPGVQFAQLPNPIFDSSHQSVPGALGDEEMDFLVGQIVTWVPRERDDMRMVLREVQDGSVTPAALIDKVRTELPQEWTDPMVFTHISGLIARLVDLGMLQRQWQGRYVRYALGAQPRVETFLQG